eukprot:jgi/Botrbrau1/15448/Bobra.43_2s0072.1
MEAFRKSANYPLIKHTDMPAEMRDEAMDICIIAVEKYQKEMEKCTQMIKDTFDKKFGSPWHVVVGQDFSFEVTSECKNLLYLFVGGSKGVLVWKL